MLNPRSTREDIWSKSLELHENAIDETLDCIEDAVFYLRDDLMELRLRLRARDDARDQLELCTSTE